MQPRTVDDVRQALDAHGLDVEIQINDESTATAEEAAEAAGCKLGQIIKSLCFTVKDKPILVLTAGDQMVDDRKIAAHFDVGRKKVRMADWNTTIEATGYEPGGVPPLGHVSQIPVFVDETLQRFDVVWAAAGSPRAIFPVELEALVDATEGTFLDVAREA